MFLAVLSLSLPLMCVSAQPRPAHYFVAFGGGPRRCIGEQFALNEALTIAAVLLRNFDIVSDPDQVIEREITLTMRSKYGIKVTLTKRTPAH